MALEVYNILSILDELRENLTVIVIGHVQNDYDALGEKRTSFKVIGGKLIGEKIEVEGMFTNVFYSEVIMEEGKPNYYFRTQSNGKDTCKTSKGLFEDLYIVNDYKNIITRIEEYDKSE